jgi:hypothetical protein
MLQGLSTTKVKIERLETTKAHKAAVVTEALLPNLVRMLDYMIVQTMAATLRDDLVLLKALLDNCGVLRVAVDIKLSETVMDPPEQTVALAISKQVRIAARLTHVAPPPHTSPYFSHIAVFLTHHPISHTSPASSQITHCAMTSLHSKRC